MCAQKMGKNIGTRGSYMSFEAYERSNFTISVPLSSVGNRVLLTLKYHILLIFSFLNE
jgi:hypothetical protein